MTYKSFEDLPVWQRSRVFCQIIFKITCQEDFRKDFYLLKQIRSSSGSLMDNIAEGFEREGNREFIQFLTIAKASAGETCSQLYRAYDCGYISEDQLKSNIKEARSIILELRRLIHYLQASPFKGQRFR